MRWAWSAAMADLMTAAAFILIGTVGVGLVRILLGPSDTDRMMATQLFGTGGIGALMLLAGATGSASAIDVALCLALLAGFVAFAFALGASQPDGPDRKGEP